MQWKALKVRAGNPHGRAMEATLSFHILVTPYCLGDNTDHFPYFLPGSKIHGTVTSILGSGTEGEEAKGKTASLQF